MQGEGSKRCTKCGESKPVSEFHRDRAQASGRKSRCRACLNAASSAYYWATKPERQAYVKANLHLYREQMRRRRADPEKREQINAQARARRKGNAEYIAKVRALQKAHPETVALIDKRRTAKRRARTQAQFVEDVH